VSDELEHIWSRVQAELALAVDEPTYRVWLQSLRARDLDLQGQRLLVEAPAQAYGWIRDRFGRVLQSCAVKVIGPDVVLELVSSQDPSDFAARRSAVNDHTGSTGGGWNEHRRGGASKRTSVEERRTAPTERANDPRSGPLGNPKLNFDQFVIGDSNRLAHAAALTVAELPAQA
jgi:chromosomal replication initiator protein